MGWRQRLGQLGLFEKARPERAGTEWFVSHATTDADTARRELAALLPGSRLRFFHQPDPPESAPIANDIIDEMTACNGVIWVDSSLSQTRDWVTWEVDTARRRGLPLYRFGLGSGLLKEDDHGPVPFQVFASYARDDVEVVGPLLDGLRERGVDVFVDVDDLRPAANLDDELEQAVAAAVDGFGFVLAFVSESSLASKWVTEELRGAIARADASKMAVVPVNVTPHALTRLAESDPWFAGRDWPSDWVVEVGNWPVSRTADEIMVRAYQIAYRNAGRR